MPKDNANNQTANEATADQPKATETKAEAFTRIALRRTNKALDAIALLRGLSNKGNYEYTAEQTAKIVSALRAGVDKVESDFAAGGPVKNDSGFTL